MKIRLNISAAGAVLTLGLSAAAYFAIPYCIAGGGATTDVGPRAFPQLICVSIAVLSAVQLILLITKRMPAKYRELSLEKHGKAFLAMALALITAIASNYVSVVIAAMVCSLLYLLLLRVKDWRGYAAVLITGGLLFILMKFALHIRF